MGRDLDLEAIREGETRGDLVWVVDWGSEGFRVDLLYEGNLADEALVLGWIIGRTWIFSLGARDTLCLDLVDWLFWQYNGAST